MTSCLIDAGRRLTVTLGVGFLGLFWAVFELARLSGRSNVECYPYWALLVASLMYLVVFVVLEYIGRRGSPTRKQYGWVALLIGADGRLSTSKTQAVLWTVILATVIVFLAGIVAFGPAGGRDLFDGTHWEQYLVLLGGPFAAAVLAKFTTVMKIQSGTIAKTSTDAASPRALGTTAATDAGPDAEAAPIAKPARVADAFSNDDGEADLPDTQYLIFNIAAIVYFLLVYVGQIFQGHTGVDRFVLPNMPSVLLALTGASAATYVGYKATQREAPRLVSVLPQPATTGQAVNLVGTSLVPAGETAAEPRTAVMIRSLAQDDSDNTAVIGPAPGVPVTASALSFVMPAQFAGKTVEVRIVTAGSVATDPIRINVN